MSMKKISAEQQLKAVLTQFSSGHKMYPPDFFCLGQPFTVDYYSNLSL